MIAVFTGKLRMKWEQWLVWQLKQIPIHMYHSLSTLFSLMCLVFLKRAEIKYQCRLPVDQRLCSAMAWFWCFGICGFISMEHSEFLKSHYIGAKLWRFSFAIYIVQKSIIILQVYSLQEMKLLWELIFFSCGLYVTSGTGVVFSNLSLFYCCKLIKHICFMISSKYYFWFLISWLWRVTRE